MDYLNAMLPVGVIGVILLGGYFAVVASIRYRKTEREADRARLD